MLSVVSIIEAAHKTDEHSVPLSATGAEPATHYGLHAWMDAAPEPHAGETVSARADLAGLAHFAAALSSAGLTRIVSPEV